MSEEKKRLKIETVALDSIYPDPANVRKHPEKNMAAIKGSLLKFGQMTPIVIDMKGIILKGNGTYLAAKELGWTEIEVVRTTLAGSQATAYGIADNRAGELAEWDYQGLGDLLKGLQEDKFDLESIGWPEYDVTPLLGAMWAPKIDENLDFDGLNGPPKQPKTGNVLKDRDAVAAAEVAEKYRQNQVPAGSAAIVVTVQQYGSIANAISSLREDLDKPEMTEGECLEYLAVEYLNGLGDLSDLDESEFKIEDE